MCLDRGGCSKAGNLCGHGSNNKTGNLSGSIVSLVPTSSDKWGGAIGYVHQ